MAKRRFSVRLPEEVFDLLAATARKNRSTPGALGAELLIDAILGTHSGGSAKRSDGERLEDIQKRIFELQVHLMKGLDLEELSKTRAKASRLQLKWEHR